MQVEVDAEYAPEQFTLHPPLADLIGLQHGTRQRILHALWHYIHQNKLQVLWFVWGNCNIHVQCASEMTPSASILFSYSS